MSQDFIPIRVHKIKHKWFIYGNFLFVFSDYNFLKVNEILESKFMQKICSSEDIESLKTHIKSFSPNCTTGKCWVLGGVDQSRKDLGL